jgi:hypothetical protein
LGGTSSSTSAEAERAEADVVPTVEDDSEGGVISNTDEKSLSAEISDSDEDDEFTDVDDSDQIASDIEQENKHKKSRVSIADDGNGSVDNDKADVLENHSKVIIRSESEIDVMEDQDEPEAKHEDSSGQKRNSEAPAISRQSKGRPCLNRPPPASDSDSDEDGEARYGGYN